MTSTPGILPINNPLSLYGIMQEHLELLQQILEADGELTPEMEEALLFNGQEMQKKSMSVAYAIKTLEYNSDILDKEIDRLQSLKQKADNAKEFLKQRLSEAMMLYGIERLDGGNMKLFFRKSEAIVVTDPAQIPEQFLEWKDPVVSKTKIKASIKAGEEVPGAQLITKQNLQIK
jgi:hypothetical protein